MSKQIFITDEFFTFPKNVRLIMNMINENKRSCFVVGGAVRNTVINKIHNMNLSIKDFDIATNATIEELTSIFKGFKTNFHGENFGVFVVTIDGEDFEIAKFRTESNYTDGRRPDNVVFTNSLIEDLERRDFKMNAMAMNILGELFDPFNGVEDIRNKLTTCVGNAKKNLTDDGLRMLRGIRFNSQLGFNFDQTSKKIIKENAELIDSISRERIMIELEKILLSDAVKGVRELIELNLFDRIIPEFTPMIGLDQKNPHHDLTLDEHTFKVMENMPKTVELQLAGLLHDVGKVKTMTVGDDGIGHFFGHEIESAKMCKDILKRLKFNNKTINAVEVLIRNHMVGRTIGKKGLKKLIAKIGKDQVEDLIVLFEADSKGKGLLSSETIKSIDDRILDIRNIINEIVDSKAPINTKDLEIGGNELIALGLKGKQIGAMLNSILELVIDEKLLNVKNVLINHAKKLIEGGGSL